MERRAREWATKLFEELVFYVLPFLITSSRAPPCDQGAGCWGSKSANNTGSTTIRAVTLSAHRVALAIAIAPLCCQAATRRNTRQIATAKTTIARISPAIRTITAACCCAKNPDPSNIWRASAVRSTVIPTTAASSPNGIRPTSSPRHTPAIRLVKRVCTGTVESSIEWVDMTSFLLHSYLTTRWYLNQAQPCRRRRSDRRRLSPPRDRPGRAWPLAPARFGR